MGLSTTVWAY
jgi:hypothetical protein